MMHGLPVFVHSLRRLPRSGGVPLSPAQAGFALNSRGLQRDGTRRIPDL